MNPLNAETSDGPMPAALKAKSLSGVGFFAQFESSSRSFGKTSFVTPISTLYASPAKTVSDLFCAFQPKRVTPPSLGLVLSVPPTRPTLSRPAIPLWAFWRDGSAARFARRVESGMDSISPAPKTGVGMRKIMLDALEKSGCDIAQLAGLSDLPEIVNRSCTPPSGVPSLFVTNRA